MPSWLSTGTRLASGSISDLTTLLVRVAPRRNSITERLPAHHFAGYEVTLRCRHTETGRRESVVLEYALLNRDGGARLDIPSLGIRGRSGIRAIRRVAAATTLLGCPKRSKCVASGGCRTLPTISCQEHLPSLQRKADG